jgi:2'-5' RNA ligase
METKASPELLFIISPPPAIAEYVAMLKQHVRLAIGHPFEDEFAKAHITLFQYRDARAEDWLYQVDTTIASFAPFHVHIKNLNFHDHGTTRTIYLEVVHKNPICEIVERLGLASLRSVRETSRTEAQGSPGTSASPGQPAWEFTPFIPIARNLDINDFINAWRSLKNLSYSDYFRCDHITVLKKASPEVSRRAPKRWTYYMDLSFAA